MTSLMYLRLFNDALSTVRVVLRRMVGWLCRWRSWPILR